MIQSTRYVALALTAGLIVSATSAQRELGDLAAAKQVELETVRKQPQAFKNVWVTFKATYLGLGAVHNPFFTRFTRKSYVNFAVWDESQQIWKQAEYDNACSTLFCDKKNGKLLEALYGLQRYQRVVLTGVIRNSWQGEPWFEITKIEPTDDTRITTASLSHMHRAWSLIDQRKWQQALIELNLASSTSLTENARGWLHAYMGLCQMRIGRPDRAKSNFATATSLIPENLVIEGWMDQLAKDPRSAIDTANRVTTIRRGDRPMWEAVEQSTSKGKSTTKRGGLRSKTKLGATPTGSTGPAKAPSKTSGNTKSSTSNTPTKSKSSGTTTNTNKSSKKDS